MRLPKILNPRINQRLLRRFGVYEKVLPVQTTPSRDVPDHIERPEYATEDPKLTKLKYPEVKNHNKIISMRKSCKLAASILSNIETFVKPGVTTDDIDEHVHNLSIELGSYPSPLYYKGFPKSVCTSVNNVAAHGIPDLRPLQDGDIINVDITVYYKGFHGDCSKTFLIGNVDDKGKELVDITEEALKVGILTCGPDVPFKEIGMRISRFARRNKLCVLPTFAGHGIGEYFHGPPDIFHVGKICVCDRAQELVRFLQVKICLHECDNAPILCSTLKTDHHVVEKRRWTTNRRFDPILANGYPGLMKPGMTFTVEPCLSHGSERVLMLDDGWTIITEDGARAAQAEHTILITEDGYEILTN